MRTEDEPWNAKRKKNIDESDQRNHLSNTEFEETKI